MNKRYALCIGNNYPGTGAELQGCVNDAKDWGMLLAAEGYDVEIITEATKAQITLGLMDLVGRLGFGDRGVFCYSGHGTWVPDSSGDEPDARDEALVPSDWTSGYLVTDDELDQIFSTRRYGAGVLMLSDSCHSGSVSKFVASGARGTPKFLPPSRLGRGLPERLDTLTKVAPTPAPAGVSLISGCGDLGYSYDASFNGRANGAFTRMAIDSFQSGISLNSWFKGLITKLPTEWYPQTPELTASAYRKYTRAI